MVKQLKSKHDMSSFLKKKGEKKQPIAHNHSVIFLVGCNNNIITFSEQSLLKHPQNSASWVFNETKLLTDLYNPFF